MSLEALNWTKAALCGLLLVLVAPLHGAPTQRVQTTQRGDFVLIGNSLGADCAAGTPAPVVGTIGTCGANLADSSPDIFWRSDSPTTSAAEANDTITPAQARSTAVLNLPAGARVTHAYLYWSTTLGAPGSDTTATVDRPAGLSQSLTAVQVLTGPNNSYRSVADVTALVQANGSGAYRVSDVDIINWVGLNNSNTFGAWWMVVLYELASDPQRTLTISDGLDPVSAASPQNFTLSGFLVPPVASGKLGIVTLEGDNTGVGDALSFNGSALSDALNPANNFFNSTRSSLGAAVSVPGDLPQLAGTPQSMSGIDLDIIDVTPYLAPGQTSASASATSSGDVYYLATFVTSINTLRPDLGDAAKTVTDVNGGAVLPGDILQYTISVSNSGSEAATLTVLNDPLPVGVTYLADSLQILTGANAGPVTDAPGDDVGEYVSGTRTVIARLGAAASSSQGGRLAVGQSTSLRFNVTVDSNCAGPTTIGNQASIATRGETTLADTTVLTDGNGAGAGDAPTVVNVNARCLTVTVGGAGSGTVTSAPAGISCGATCAAAFGVNAVVQLTATPSAGSSFGGWSGDLAGSVSPSGITLDTNKNVTATFRLNQSITGFAATPANPVFSSGGTFSVTAAGGASGQPVVFAITTPLVCTISGSTVTMLGTGLCTLTANQAGNANYAPAPQVSLNVTISSQLIFKDGFENPVQANGASGMFRLPGFALQAAVNELPVTVYGLDDEHGEALRVYARRSDGHMLYALALRGTDGALALGAWQPYDHEPLLQWTARATSAGWVLQSAQLQ